MVMKKIFVENFIRVSKIKDKTKPATKCDEEQEDRNTQCRWNKNFVRTVYVYIYVYTQAIINSTRIIHIYAPNIGETQVGIKEGLCLYRQSNNNNFTNRK